ncbi:MAG: hypothetical protein AAF604_15875 [Acidobacteriota bacterium]
MSVRKRWPSTETLLGAPPSAIRPFFLEVARRQAASRQPADLMRQWAQDPFVAPSAHDQRVLHRLDGLALAAAPEFSALQLSPVAPLGVCSVVAPTSQDRTLTAQRGTEVVSDPTNVLAVECARRLRLEPQQRVRLCCSHQTLRAQALPDEPGYSQHFRLFVLAQGGRGLPEDGFETRAFVEHAQVFDRLFDHASTELGCRFEDRQAQLLVANGQETLGERVATVVRQALPDVDLQQNELTASYYDGIRLLFGARSPRTGQLVLLADTGRFDWLAQLNANRKLRFVASGLGLQLLDSLFRDS